MDLKDLKPKEDSVEITLHHPVSGEVLLNDDDDSPMTISVISSLSKKYKERLFEMSRSSMKKEVFSGDEPGFNELYEFSVDFLADMTTGWNITLMGKSPEYSKDAAKELYSDYAWVKEQVDAGVSNAVNVFTND